MTLGKPVVGTASSGNTDFMTADNSLVDTRLVPVVTDHRSYAADVVGEGQLWAEPDIDSAARVGSVT